jgi:alkylation response protein AidB-like acyl-CoA dehydrogenase
MILDLNPEQKLMRESVERFFRENYTFDRRKAVLQSPCGFDPAIWQHFADFGWLAAPFSEDDGGIGGGVTEAAIVMEGIGRNLALEPYLPSVVLAGGLLAALGTTAQKSDYLQRLVDGSLMMALAFVEPQSRYDLADCLTTARLHGDGFVLDGRKSVVLGGADAGAFIVVARSQGGPRHAHGISLFIVPRDTTGVSTTPYPTIDGLRACELTLDGVHVAAASLLGPLHESIAPLERAIDTGIAAIASEAVGAMSALFDLTLDYLKTREQFGRPLGANQALQHRMVDMHIALEETRALAGYGIRSLANSDCKARKKALSALKIQTGRAARLIGQEGVQLHGAMGVTDECPVSHYFKRLTMIDVAFGNVSWHEQRFAAN